MNIRFFLVLAKSCKKCHLLRSPRYLMLILSRNLESNCCCGWGEIEIQAKAQDWHSPEPTCSCQAPTWSRKSKARTFCHSSSQDWNRILRKWHGLLRDLDLSSIWRIEQRPLPKDFETSRNRVERWWPQEIWSWRSKSRSIFIINVSWQRHMISNFIVFKIKPLS